MFAAAAALGGAERGAYLDDACRGDAALRAVVESMLAGHDEAGSFGDASLLAGPDGGKRLAPGSQLGVFRIESLIGAGGMGEVYRAHDTKLQRAVALKVLPESFALDPDRRRRFAQEALALASLNHINVGAIYGLEETAGVTALVLELVEGPTLADVLAAGPLPPADVLSTARQMAEALEAAHEHGIIHRDLKPANVKVTAEGIVKVLDFGLAKAARAPAPARLDTDTRAADGTALGLVVGTAAYMSPEQARGQPVDRRTDIWAFGCVLFEMLTGRPPFAGATITDTLVAVLEREPDWTLVPASTPPAIARLLRRCLIKDARLRLRDIGEARIALTPGLELEPGQTPSWHPRRTPVSAAIAGVAVVAWLGFTMWEGPGPTAAPVAGPVRFFVPPPDGASFVRTPARTFLMLSPDGSQLAFVAATSGGSRVFLRTMGDLEGRPVPGSEGALSVFWSPDGRALAFFADGKLKRVDISGGAAVTICDVPAAALAHGTWGADGVILFATTQGTAIFQVPAAGGPAVSRLTPDRANGEVRVHWPWFLPDGRRFLYTARRTDSEGELRLGTLDGSTRGLMPVSSNAQWIDPDLVVFVRDGVLMAQRVELEAARAIGEPFPVADRVDFLLSSSRAMFTAARTGTIAFHSGGDRSQLVWVDRSGNELETVGAPADYSRDSARLSADDGMLLVSRWQAGPGTFDIWRLDLTRGTEERLTDDRGSEVTPVFSEDGREIFFAADKGGSVPTLYRRNLVTGVEQPLVPGAGIQQKMMDLIPGQRTVVFAQRSRQGTYDIFQLPLAGGPPAPLVESRPDKGEARVSPDGRALAFTAFDGVRTDLYVAPLPITSPPIAAAADLRGAPRWSRDGRQLYFVGPANALMAVAVQTGPALKVGTPRRLFQLARPAVLFDVSREGRFLLLVPQVMAAELPISVAIAALSGASR